MRWLALVRNVMLGREGLHRAVLLEIVEDSGGEDPRSFLTTGNLTFSAGPTELERVRDAVEQRVERVLGRREPLIVRPMSWLAELVAEDPFGPYEDEDWELEVCLLPHSAPGILADRLGDSGRTVLVEVRDLEVLTARPRQGPNRPHGNRLLERATGQRATARGWSTLHRIHAHDLP